jgi:teichuronic acid biosynthesis glycosyltransferase TuaG
MDGDAPAQVSVVIPCFRCGATIGRAVVSVAGQTQKPVEILLVDDASEDDTLSVLEELVCAYAGWVRVIALAHNLGPAGARNAGWEAATQPYVAFLDADDSWHPEKIRIQYGFMRDNPEIEISGHRCVWVRSDEIRPPVRNTITVTSISALHVIFGTRFSTPTVMLKRSIPFRFEVTRRYAEDVHLWRQVACASGRVARIESPLAYMHKAPYGASGLSADMWAMEKGNLNSLRSLYKAKQINWMLFALGSTFSIAKYLRRIAHVQLTRTLRFSCN